MEWHRRRRIISAAFAAGAALLIGFAAATAYFVVTALDSERARLEKNALAAELRDLLQYVVDAETSVRGYVIGGDTGFLEPYHRALPVIDDIGEKLAAGGVLQNSELLNVLERRLAQFKDVIEATRTGGMAAGQAVIREGSGRLYMDEIRAQVADAISDIEADVMRESEALQRNAYLLTFSVAVVVLIALALSTVQFALFRAEISRRGTGEAALLSRTNEIQLLSNLASALQAAGMREESYAIIEGLAGQLLHGTAGSLYIYSHSRDHLQLGASWGGALEMGALPPSFVPDACWALRRGVPLVGRVGAAPLNCAHVSSGNHSYMCMPIHAQGAVYGVLHLVSPSLDYEHAFEPVAAVAEGLCEQLSLALANIELRERLRNLAIRDGLTGLYNRRFLEEFLERELARADRAKTSIAIALLDIDHFKMFNDTYGHGVGDEVLKRLAAYLAAAVRKSDVVCRYGGEEIVLVLPECDVERARTVAEKLREGISRLELTDAGVNLPRVTASIGVTVYPDLCSHKGELLASADKAMYRAKRAGRNRVCLANEEPEPAAAPPAETQPPVAAPRAVRIVTRG